MDNPVPLCFRGTFFVQFFKRESLTSRKDYFMKTINGVYCSANIFTPNNPAAAIDNYAAAQLQTLCGNEVSRGCNICIMPD